MNVNEKEDRMQRMYTFIESCHFVSSELSKGTFIQTRKRTNFFETGFCEVP